MVEKFPRSQRLLLGDRIQSTALDVLGAGAANGLMASDPSL
jgi:hypothetical protein